MLKQKTLHQVIIFYVCFLAMQTDKRCTYMKNSLLLLLTSKSRFYYLATFVHGQRPLENFSVFNLLGGRSLTTLAKNPAHKNKIGQKSGQKKIRQNKIKWKIKKIKFWDRRWCFLIQYTQ